MAIHLEFTQNITPITQKMPLSSAKAHWLGIWQYKTLLFWVSGFLVCSYLSFSLSHFTHKSIENHTQNGYIFIVWKRQ